MDPAHDEQLRVGWITGQPKLGPDLFNVFQIMGLVWWQGALKFKSGHVVGVLLGQMKIDPLGWVEEQAVGRFITYWCQPSQTRMQKSTLGSDSENHACRSRRDLTPQLPRTPIDPPLSLSIWSSNGVRKADSLLPPSAEIDFLELFYVGGGGGEEKGNPVEQDRPVSQLQY